LCFIRGLPGSGKTYFAKHLFDFIETDQKILLDPDATDYNSKEYKNHVIEQTKEGVDPKLFPYRFLRTQAYDAIEQHKIIIWNQPFSNIDILKKVIARLQEHAQEHDTKLQILFVETDIDPTIAWQRVTDRKNKGGHGPSEEIFKTFVNQYSSVESLGYPTISIDGQKDPVLNIQPVISKIFDLQKT
jgi:tRNA uridine 5-carbamoylmethylation protein Kti12